MIYTIDLPDFGPVRFEQDEYSTTWCFGLNPVGGVLTDIPEEVTAANFPSECLLWLMIEQD